MTEDLNKDLLQEKKPNWEDSKPRLIIISINISIISIILVIRKYCPLNSLFLFFLVGIIAMIREKSFWKVLLVSISPGETRLPLTAGVMLMDASWFCQVQTSSVGSHLSCLQHRHLCLGSLSNHPERSRGEKKTLNNSLKLKGTLKETKTISSLKMSNSVQQAWKESRGNTWQAFWFKQN